MSTEVECYAGGSSPETPRAFTWEGQRYLVGEVLTRRREPTGLGYLVHCSPGDAIFDLFYLIEAEQWQIQPKGFIIDKEGSIKPQETKGD
jgi:hypothetical protein